MEQEMIYFISKALPKLKIHGYRRNTHGWDNDIIIVNENTVFRFPKNDKVADRVMSEALLLKKLNRHKPFVTIPDYTLLYDENNKLRCVYYEYIEGQPLEQQQINDRNAMLLGDFLTKLHRMNHPKLSTLHTYDYWNDLFTSVRENVYPELSEFQQQTITCVFTRFLDTLPTLSYPTTVIHGDLSTSNIIWNEGEVTGIIDFTDAQIGDPAFDFAGFYWEFGPEFTKKVLSYYEGIESKESIFERVESFYGLQPVFHELLHSIHNDEIVEWDSALWRFLNLSNLCGA
ncbi:aminoglycoside 2''-phosphotransferase [Virgibacillus subterraneus]|uniref:Aminoglycoside 2''-phosphotransferase n=1 Tax=Virgibacillus subterraneus TaxID=621109 RepID=A0A1H9JX35_9BACI|nr:aminoglycoside phosphotransferase family protein [Virgibacillus subterraneus]SEQ91380.1 aminoglycoside 2''-phosphotransferase [Virgibacillus subterraneus]